MSPEAWRNWGIYVPASGVGWKLLGVGSSDVNRTVYAFWGKIYSSEGRGAYAQLSLWILFTKAKNHERNNCVQSMWQGGPAFLRGYGQDTHQQGQQQFLLKFHMQNISYKIFFIAKM